MLQALHLSLKLVICIFSSNSGTINADDDEPRRKEPRIADTLPFSDEVLTGGDVPEAEAFSVPEQFENGM